MLHRAYWHYRSVGVSLLASLSVRKSIFSVEDVVDDLEDDLEVDLGKSEPRFPNFGILDLLDIWATGPLDTFATGCDTAGDSFAAGCNTTGDDPR